MKRVYTISSKTVIQIIGVIGGILALLFLQRIVLIICAAFILGAAASFGAMWMERYHVPRVFAVMGVFGLMICVLVVAVAVFVPILLTQLTALIDEFPQTVQSITNALPPQLEAWGETIQQEISIQALFSDISQSLVSTTLNIMGVVVSLVLTLVLGFYIAVEPQAFDTVFARFAPLEQRGRVRMYLSQARQRVGQWVIGHLTVALLLGFAVFVILVSLQIQNPLALAFLAGLLQLIPFVGPVLAAIPAFLFAWLESPYFAMLVLMGYVLLYQIETLFLTPILLRQNAGLNPVIIILALLVGARLAGIAGFFLAVPLAGFISVFWTEVRQGIQEEMSKDVADK